MRLVRFLALGVTAAAVASCSQDTDGTTVTLDPLAGLRYVNAVADTGALDFRVIDIVGNAPNAVAATYRTGGLPYGTPNNIMTQPPYQPVRAGTRQIRVFMNGTTPAVASQIVFDTTFNFLANRNYTFILAGFARTGSTPAVNAFIVLDSVPAVPAGRYAVRVINVAPTLASSVNQPANLQVPVDVAVTAGGGAVPAGAPTFSNLAYGNASTYATLDTSSVAATALPYRVVATANGTTTPILFSGTLPIGVRGTSVDNPTAGTRVVGSGLTVLITARSVPGSQAPAAPATRAVTSITRSNDTATVTASAAHGLAVGDVVNISGATQPEYNGPATVVVVPSTTTFRYRLAGTPVTPATGTSVFRIAQQGALNRGLDFSTPAVTYLIDQRPPNTAP